MMKTLKDHTIIYDSECPMCHLYTGAFVKHGFLEKNGRKAFCELSEEDLQQLDLSRSYNEIPLIDSKTGEITYGIESLFKVLAHRFPFLSILFGASWFKWLTNKAYSFVSYNRKVIIPGSQFEKTDSCAPTFNLKYRVAYLMFVWLITAWVLSKFSTLLIGVLPTSGFYRELFIAGGQMVVLGIATVFYDRSKLMYYLGNLITVSLMGALMLVPIILLNSFISTGIYVTLGYFGFVVLVMFIEHKRRLSILNLPSNTFSAIWVLYRLIILCLILAL